jgi:hypothetical protein
MFNSKIPILLAVILLLTVYQTSAVISNCGIYANSGSTCTYCNPGYSVTNSGATCTAIVCSSMSECTLCDTTSTCLTCSFGYTPSSNRASCDKISCDDGHCDLCASTSANQCYSCAATYYVDNYACTLCTNTISSCNFCELSNSNLICTACLSTYYTSTTTTCDLCSTSDSNCYNCDSTGAGTMLCFDCFDTHYISDYAAGTCTICSNGVSNC